MIDLDLKKKIANTLSRYELKCDKLQLEIDTFKNVLNQLIVSPGINPEKDEHFSILQAQLDADFDAVEIEKKAKRLIHVVDNLEKQKAKKNQNMLSLIQKSTESLNKLANKSQDKRAVNKLQKMIADGLEHEAILTQLHDALSLCAGSVLRELEDTKEQMSSKGPNEAEISTQVNQSLQQLLNHLSIPEDLDGKRDSIKTRLEQQLTGDNLTKVIDGLTELVVDAFNVEQNRFKGFLQQLTNQVQDFDVFLKSAESARSESSTESRQLESDIQGDIDQIKSDIDSSKTIEELSMRVNQNLTVIGERIKEYRTSEQLRDKEYTEQVNRLKRKLSESEQNAEEIKTILTYQKYKINHDALTGLPNRESYDEFATEALNRWKENGAPLSLAVADIDHFKRINDTYGHLAGDKVLKKVATIFKSAMRDGDYIARYGGEEFVLIFEDTNPKAVWQIVEKLRKSIEQCQFAYRDHRVDVTVSFGITTIIKGDNIESLFMRADNALYQAKDGGRNRSAVL